MTMNEVHMEAMACF